ncbi:hypothetical protein [Burkholderia cepacia]|uniref:hypothetical protein n=1 Tax=Burkholderia cepacia TaxID=292 RepID=UPI0021AB7D47|nr:hypothetical protein [Burkholderia cepacia]
MADSIAAADTPSVVPVANAATVVASRPARIERGSAQAGAARNIAAVKPAAVARSRKAHDGTPERQHRAAPVAEVVQAAPPRARKTQPPTAPVAVTTATAAEAVGMTAAEFTHWLAATREIPRPAAESMQPDTSGTDLTVTLPGHPRLLGR